MSKDVVGRISGRLDVDVYLMKAWEPVGVQVNITRQVRG